MIKSYAEMRRVDVSPYVEKRDGIDYLNWARCKELLHENGAQVVYYEPMVNGNGSSLFMSDQTFTDAKGNVNRCYEVRVKIHIDDLEFVFNAPVMNGCNPVKDNSMSQQRVQNAQARAFVKGVAIRTGLGFGLWLKEDPESVGADDDLSRHSLASVKVRMQQEYTRVLRDRNLTTKEIAEKCGMTEDEVKVLFTYFAQLERFEDKLIGLAQK